MGKTKRPDSWQAYGAIDSHAHLEQKTYGPELDAVLSKAWAMGLSHIVLVAASEDPAVFTETAALARTDDRLSMVAGVHPHCAKSAATLQPVLIDLLDQKQPVAVGEIGLDYHYNFSSPDTQRTVFAEQLELATRYDLPVVLHIREAFDDALTILDRHADTYRGVVHCFTGTAEESRAFIQRGFHISFPGIITFGAKAEPLREAARAVPMDRLLVETDSPYLAPHPFRGRRNEPAMVAFVVDEVARCKGLSPQEVAKVTGENTRRLFGIS